MTNTNKLVKFYQGCDGGKTGYTTEALFCLSATAKRGDTRIIATVIGEQNGKQRFKDVSDLFNYSFKAYENEVVVRKGENIGKTVKVEKGKQSEVEVYADENVSVFKKRAGDDNVEIVYELSDSVKAPVKRGDVVGNAKIVKNGVVIKTVELKAADNVDKENFFDAIRRILSNW